MTDGPTLASLLDALAALGVVRAATWFDEMADAYFFAVSFRQGRRGPSHDLQRPLESLTSVAASTEAVTTALPDFAGGRLVADVGARTITVELARVVREEREERVSIDLTSVESLYARPGDEASEPADPKETAPGEGAWDVEWHVTDLPTDWDGAHAAFEAMSQAHGWDAAGAGALVSSLEAFEKEFGEGDEDEDEYEDEVDPAAWMAALDEALAELRSAGVGGASVRYSARPAMQGILGAMNAAAADDCDEVPSTPGEIAAFTSEVAEEFFEDSPWQLGDVELDGRRVTDETPGVTALQKLARVVLEARFGDWNELGSTSAFGISGRLGIDVDAATAAAEHRYPVSRLLEPERVELRPWA